MRGDQKASGLHAALPQLLAMKTLNEWNVLWRKQFGGEKTDNGMRLCTGQLQATAFLPNCCQHNG